MDEELNDLPEWEAMDDSFDIPIWVIPEMDDAEALRIFRETEFLHRSVKK